MADQITRLAGQQAAARAQIVRAVQGRLVPLWRGFNKHYSDPAVAAFAAAAARIVRAGQVRTAGITHAYLLRVLAEMGAAPRNPAGVVIPDNLRDGVSLDGEFERVVRSFRYLRSQRVTLTDAREQSERRALIVANTDIALAMREAARQTLRDAAKVTGYRRIIHPEKSAGGTCGLCVVASARVYQTEELMPLHEGCWCTVMPVTADSDPGHRLNQADLKGVYAAAGSTGAADLKRTRYVIHQHGELGPVLANADHDWRSPADVAAATG